MEKNKEESENCVNKIWINGEVERRAEDIPFAQHPAHLKIRQDSYQSKEMNGNGISERRI